jgi:hypothetical protein
MVGAVDVAQEGCDIARFSQLAQKGADEAVEECGDDGKPLDGTTTASIPSLLPSKFFKALLVQVSPGLLLATQHTTMCLGCEASSYA